jgi:hypothetical protein
MRRPLERGSVRSTLFIDIRLAHKNTSDKDPSLFRQRRR